MAILDVDDEIRGLIRDNIEINAGFAEVFADIRVRLVHRIAVHESPFFLETDDVSILNSWNDFVEIILYDMSSVSRVFEIFERMDVKPMMEAAYDQWRKAMFRSLRALESAINNKGRHGSRFFINEDGIYCYTSNLRDLCEPRHHDPLSKANLEFSKDSYSRPEILLGQFNTLNKTVEDHISRYLKNMIPVNYHPMGDDLYYEHEDMIVIHRTFEHVYEREGVRFLNWLIHEYGFSVTYITTMSLSKPFREVQKFVRVWEEFIQQFRSVYRYRKGIDALNSLLSLNEISFDSWDPRLETTAKMSLNEYMTIYNHMISSPLPIEKIRASLRKIPIAFDEMFKV